MIRIGDFSRLSRVSVKTLRYYDETGLLQPVQVDRFTGYRYYEYHQLLRLNRILALKEMGFSLEAIRELLSGDLLPDQLRGMLKLRQTEAKRRVEEEADRLQRVEVRLKQIEQEDEVPKYEVILRQIPAMHVVSTRDVVPTPPDQGTLWRELGQYLATQRVRTLDPCLTLYHDNEYKERDWDVEVCQPVEGQVPETVRVKAHVLPAVESMACTLHPGTFATIGEAYDAIMKWIDANSYRICGPAREMYLREAQAAEPGQAVMINQSDPNTVTEVQFPVEKVK